ncbi:tRNA (adenosine(37)-N6)-dimethylallyltransferase MiaA [Lacticaseibacillus porcinae]|uniref:tRNA (adenosine(37)-N6)-dimethylallyltransferase MiaA n=1 Tax=Lacticaseibacillus porcinae TaxID=1123687 RepID=UPI000F7B12E6|nr:tRNA (adenosine(37)-N6)-dimethylallyltransferase MiaA [Lacticaseibacillus porcinae]
MPGQILMIGGPTAVGKTALSIRLAKAFDGEVVNADAYQIYRGMDIGTAKATLAERDGVVHHLLDVVEPTAAYSVAQFKQAAKTAIADIQKRGKLPIVVGGTGFYMNALRLDLPLGGQAPPSDYREHLQQALVEHDEQWLWAKLNAIDPQAAEKIPPANSRRVIRALEVMHTTGVKFSQQPESKPAYDALVIGLTTERQALYQRINQRVTLMVQAGLIPEVKHILELAGPDAQSLKAIGYKELIPYLQGTATLAQAVELIQKNSRHYAKRQLTYFKHQMPTHWFDLVAQPQSYQELLTLVTNWRKMEESF